MSGLLHEDLNIQKIVLSSGYFNFPKYLVDSLRNSKGDYNIDILTSSPKCKGFYKGGFVKKNIPNFYRVFENKILKINKKDEKLKNKIKIYEYFKDGWSYHSKGIWLYEKDKKYPSLTIIGSSNFSKNRFYLY